MVVTCFENGDGRDVCHCCYGFVMVFVYGDVVVTTVMQNQRLKVVWIVARGLLVML